MRNRMFKKYFVMVSAVILLSVFCLGAVLLLISYNSIHRIDKKYMMNLYNKYITSSGTDSVNERGELVRKYSTQFLGQNKCDVIILDGEGYVLYFSGNSAAPLKFKDEKFLNAITDTPTYQFGSIDGFYKNQIVHAVTTQILMKDQVKYLILTKADYVPKNQMIKVTYLAVGMLVIVTAFVIFASYIITKDATLAATQLADAAKRYSKGDFSLTVSIDERSELSELAQALNLMAAKLEKSETIRNSFIANVSHELRTPMTSIGGFVDGMLDGTIPPEEHKKYLTIVSGETKRLTKLVYSMLNMTKLESGEIKLNRTECDIVEIIVSCLTSFEKRIDEKGIQICGLDREMIKVYADKDLLHQVVYNLTENAIKFVNESGYIEYNFKTLEDGTFFFSISNSGDGIDKEELPLVFNKFYKTDKSRGLDKTGMGIGLYLCQSIIKLHDGKIEVSSAQGVSTEFSFTISQNDSEKE